MRIPVSRPAHRLRAGFLNRDETQATGYQIVATDANYKGLFTLTENEKKALRFMPLATLLPITLSFYYWWMQYHYLSSPDGDPLSTFSKIQRGYVILDMITNVPEYAKKLLDASAVAKNNWRPHLRLLGNDVPSVDVAIVCCNEDLSVILDTVRAALNTDWPSDRIRFIVSDDGAQKSVEKGVQLLQEEYPNSHLFYTARQRTPANSHKAGNLNHVLEYTSQLPGGHASFIAGLDADMIPARHWLRAQFPHLLRDPKMGFTCPPSCFYNVPVDDPLSQSLFVFHKYEEMIKDGAGIAWCTGSGWVMRRAALAEIGGFPSLSLTEDVLCGNLLVGKGWRSAFVSEELQWGLVPETYNAHVRQRTRWSTGGFQAGLIMKLGLYGDRSSDLTGWQRAYTFWYLVHNFTATLKALDVIKTLVMLLAGWPVVIYTGTEQLIALARVSAAVHALLFLRQCLVGYVCGYGATCRDQLCPHFMNPYYAIKHLKTFVLPKWLGGYPNAFFAKFRSTGSIPDELHERSHLHRASLSKRLTSVLIKDGAVFQSFIAVTLIAGILRNFKTASNLYGLSSRNGFLYLLPRVLWVTSFWPTYIVAYLQPFYYALRPPTMPDRELLLSRNTAGVAYPRERAKNPKSPVRGLGIELATTLWGFWAIVLFLWSW